MKRKIAAAVAIATVTMLILFVALPLLVAPATAINIQTFDNIQSEQKVQSNQLDWNNWWTNSTRTFLTDVLGFNISADFLSGEFVPIALNNIKFGLDFAHLVEFNDSNVDGYYTFNASDQILKQYNLLNDVYWNSFNITIDWPVGQILPNSINLNITGQEADEDFTISFIVSIY